ncbi:MAG TPA: hypothetical protein PK122_02320 [Candidatus Paceibacterota bacterium]|nr:hypothetical protein [Candidatus Paceibacterota bacterium]
MFYRLDHKKELTKITDLKRFKAIAISDLHVGGEEAILPPYARDDRGNIIIPTTDQEALYNNLMASLRNEKEIDILFLLGDLVDGRNPKAGGIGTVNTDLLLTTYWAYELLSEVIDIIKPKIVIGIQGSNYHVSTSGSDLDMDILKKLSANFDNISFLYDQKIYGHLGNKVWYLVHNIGGDWKNPPFPALTRLFTDLQKSSFKNNIPLPTVIGAGHFHSAQAPVMIYPSDLNPCFGFVAPCQKLGDRHTGSGTYLRFPDIGYMVIEQDDVDISGKFVRTYKQCSEVRDLTTKIGLHVKTN